jgi:hypothetical protein
LDGIIGLWRITIQFSPSILAKPIRFKPPNCKRLQGAVEVRRRMRRRTFVLRVPDNKADAVSCEHLKKKHAPDFTFTPNFEYAQGMQWNGYFF